MASRRKRGDRSYLPQTTNPPGLSSQPLTTQQSPNTQQQISSQIRLNDHFNTFHSTSHNQPISTTNTSGHHKTANAHCGTISDEILNRPSQQHVGNTTQAHPCAAKVQHQHLPHQSTYVHSEYVYPDKTNSQIHPLFESQQPPSSVLYTPGLATAAVTIPLHALGLSTQQLQSQQQQQPQGLSQDPISSHNSQHQQSSLLLQINSNHRFSQPIAHQLYLSQQIDNDDDYQDGNLDYSHIRGASHSQHQPPPRQQQHRNLQHNIQHLHPNLDQNPHLNHNRFSSRRVTFLKSGSGTDDTTTQDGWGDNSDVYQPLRSKHRHTRSSQSNIMSDIDHHLIDKKNQHKVSNIMRKSGKNSHQNIVSTPTSNTTNLKGGTVKPPIKRTRFNSMSYDDDDDNGSEVIDLAFTDGEEDEDEDVDDKSNSTNNDTSAQHPQHLLLQYHNAELTSTQLELKKLHETSQRQLYLDCFAQTYTTPNDALTQLNIIAKGDYSAWLVSSKRHDSITFSCPYYGVAKRRCHRCPQNRVGDAVFHAQHTPYQSIRLGCQCRASISYHHGQQQWIFRPNAWHLEHNHPFNYSFQANNDMASLSTPTTHNSTTDPMDENGNPKKRSRKTKNKRRNKTPRDDDNDVDDGDDDLFDETDEDENDDQDDLFDSDDSSQSISPTKSKRIQLTKSKTNNKTTTNNTLIVAESNLQVVPLPTSAALQPYGSYKIKQMLLTQNEWNMVEKLLSLKWRLPAILNFFKKRHCDRFPNSPFLLTTAHIRNYYRTLKRHYNTPRSHIAITNLDEEKDFAEILRREDVTLSTNLAAGNDNTTSLSSSVAATNINNNTNTAITHILSPLEQLQGSIDAVLFAQQENDPNYRKRGGRTYAKLLQQRTNDNDNNNDNNNNSTTNNNDPHSYGLDAFQAHYELGTIPYIPTTTIVAADPTNNKPIVLANSKRKIPSRAIQKAQSTSSLRDTAQSSISTTSIYGTQTQTGATSTPKTTQSHHNSTTSTTNKQPTNVLKRDDIFSHTNNNHDDEYNFHDGEIYDQQQDLEQDYDMNEHIYDQSPISTVPITDAPQDLSKPQPPPLIIQSSTTHHSTLVPLKGFSRFDTSLQPASPIETQVITRSRTLPLPSQPQSLSVFHHDQAHVTPPKPLLRAQSLLSQGDLSTSNANYVSEENSLPHKALSQRLDSDNRYQNPQQQQQQQQHPHPHPQHNTFQSSFANNLNTSHKQQYTTFGSPFKRYTNQSNPQEQQLPKHRNIHQLTRQEQSPSQSKHQPQQPQHPNQSQKTKSPTNTTTMSPSSSLHNPFIHTYGRHHTHSKLQTPATGRHVLSTLHSIQPQPLSLMALHTSPLQDHQYPQQSQTMTYSNNNKNNGYAYNTEQSSTTTKHSKFQPLPSRFNQQPLSMMGGSHHPYSRHPPLPSSSQTSAVMKNANQTTTSPPKNVTATRFLSPFNNPAAANTTKLFVFPAANRPNSTK